MQIGNGAGIKRGELRDAFKKKIVKFGDFVVKGGRGSFQKPNFYIPLNWDF